MTDDTRQSTRTVRWPRGRLAVAILVAALAIEPAVAIELPNLYTVQVPIDSEQSDPRADAYKRGLWEVVVRVTGSEFPADAPLLEELFPNPARYVLQFRQGVDDTLSVSYDGRAIENVLRAAGETVWGPDRPLTLVWLAVDWGDGQREVVASAEPDPVAGASRSIDRNRLLRQRVLETASRRGIPVVFPLLDTEDLRNVSFADIWGGFDEQLLQAAKRYQADSVLVGRVRPAAISRNRWSYYFGGARQEWNGEPEDAINLIADSLAAEFAFAGNAPLETVTLNVSGIDSVKAYGSVQHLLENLRLIEDIDVHTVSGDTIQYQLRLRGGSARLQRALELSGMLMPVDNSAGVVSPLSDFHSLEYMYRAPGRKF